jgi:N-acetyl-gamma-glutamyl-phosphate reductase
MIEAYESGVAPAFELYGLGLEHKHVPELQAYTGLTRRPIFIPSVGSFKQGMLVSVPLHLDDLPGKPSAGDLEDALRRHYGDGGLVSVVSTSRDGKRVEKLEPEGLNDTDRLELRVFENQTYRHAVLVARLDNLGKGASGAAVQNARLMMGLD